MANNLRALRRARSLAVWGLAAQSRTSASRLCGIEWWGCRPQAHVRKRIADALAEPVTDLWPDEWQSELWQVGALHVPIVVPVPMVVPTTSFDLFT